MKRDPFDTKWFNSVIPGTKLVAVGARDLDWLTSDNIYVALNGKEEGIFETRPYVSITGDDGKTHSCHLSRFALYECDEKENIC